MSTIKNLFHKGSTILCRFPKAIFILLIILSVKSFSQTHTAITKVINSNIHGYWEYLPADYKTSQKKYPLLIFIHGIGELGDGSQAALQTVLRNGPPKLINNGTFPTSFTVNGVTSSFIVISPQFTTNYRNEILTRTLIDYCVANYNVDTTRIYITGLSLGGGFAWNYAGATLTNAKRLAGLLTVCGYAKETAPTVANIANAGLPVWSTHNNQDPTVPSSFSVGWIDSLNAFTPPINPPALLNIFQAKVHDAWTKTYDPAFKPNGLNVYEWMLQYSRVNGKIVTSSQTASNPVASITGTNTITLPVNSTVLDGSKSSVAGGTIKSYLWKLVSGPTGYSYTNASTSTVNLTNLIAGNYTFQLTITDDKGYNASTTTAVTVNPPANKIPVAVIQGVTTITLPVDSTVLNGTASSDTDGVIKTYAWKYVSGPAAVTSGVAVEASYKISKLVAGTYQFQLTVTDDKGAAAATTIQVVVNQPVNKPPVAIVQGVTTITLPIDSTILNASASKDSDGVIKSYAWKFLTGPAASSLATGTGSLSTESVLKLNQLVEGTYQYLLTVTDDKGATATTVAQVVVNPLPNKLPVAKIKGGTTKTMPSTATALYGNVSTDSDGTIAAYSWKCISGKAGYILSGANTSTLTFSKMSVGTYTLQLTVTDNRGGKDSATVVVTEYAAATSALAANNEKSITDDAVSMNTNIAKISGMYKAGLTIAPVPVRDRLNVIMNDANKGKVLIRVVDANGKTVIVKDNLQKTDTIFQSYLDVNQLPSGLYYFEAITGAKKYTDKFIKIN